MPKFLFILVPKEPRISRKVFVEVAHIIINLGNLIVGSILIPYLFDKLDIRFVILSLVGAPVCWAIGLYFINKYDE